MTMKNMNISLPHMQIFFLIEFVRGEKCRFIKSENLELADDLYMTKKYEDERMKVTP